MDKKVDIPVAFFFFNRFDTTKKVFEAIRIDRPKKLYLISDGARKERIGEDEKVREIRRSIEEGIDWPCEVKKNYADKNMGCKERIVSGITWVFEQEDMAVILEDDCRPTQDFFRYTKELLLRYHDDEKVMMVSGSKMVDQYVIKGSYIFSRYPAIWGWATWKRAWDKYDIKIKSWSDTASRRYLKKKYDLWTYIKMKYDLDRVYLYQYDTWDYQWRYAMAMNDGLNIVPRVNMIENLGIGHDDAVHTTTDIKCNIECGEMTFPLEHPADIRDDKGYDMLYQKLHWGPTVMIKKLLSKIRK